MTHSFAYGNTRLFLPSLGRVEIKHSLQRNLFVALVISIAIHGAIVGSYYTKQYFTGDEDAPLVTVRLMRYSELGPPPSIMNAEQVPVVGVAISTIRPTIGIPVPVPDVEVNPEQTIATQRELSQVESPVVSPEANVAGGVKIEQDIRIEDEPEPDAFVPVEKNPIPVKQIKPEYPEFARRLGVEGMVWVKLLIDKEGKPKKAIIVKSDAEFFNEPATQAALQWVFTPAVMNGGPVMVWVAIPFRFQLNKQSL